MEWVGDIPSHWEVKPMFAVGNECKQKNRDGFEANLLSLSYGEIIEKDIESNSGLLPESFDTYQKVEPNDLVFRLTDLQNDKRSLRSARSNHSGIITSAYLTFRPTRCDSRYLAYLMRSYDLTKVFYSMGSGLRQSLKYSDFRRMPILLPPLEEQRAIADFLDRELEKIDELMHKQSKLLQLAKEWKQAAIDHAMDLKPEATQIEFGKTKMKYVAKLNPSVPQSLRANPDTEVSFMPMDFLSETGQIYLGEGRTAEELIGSYSYFEDGDFLVAKVTPCFENGKGAVVMGALNRHGFGTTEVSVFRPKDASKTLPEYLYFVTMTSRFRRGGVGYMTGAGGLKRVPERFMKEFEFHLPATATQRAILGELRQKLDDFNVVSSAAEQLISKLLELRNALVNEAVTGKISIGGSSNGRL